MKDSLKLIYSSNTSNIYLSEDQSRVFKVIINDLPSDIQLKQYYNELEISKYLNLTSSRKANSITQIDGHEALVLEYVEGATLKEYLKKKKPDEESLTQLAIKIIKVVDDIHKKGVIHKDINGSNIIVSKNGDIKIIDFGISSCVDLKLISQVSPENLEGTLTHISPEQTGRMNRKIDYKSDYYSFGVLLYEMFTGSLPFTTTDLNKLVYSHIAVKPDIEEDINPVIREIILKLLSKNPEERYLSAKGIIDDLELYFKKPEDFIPGKSDISRTFKIPEKLYGREREVKELINIFNSLESEGAIFALVKGYSGVGKSSLIEELHPYIAGKDGFFISGKYSEYQRKIPYSAIRDAFKEYVSYVLMQPKERFNRIRNNILKMIGNNGEILIDLIPDIEQLIGKQPKLPSLGVMENENRVKLVFTNFINSISSKKSPLVIFIDDLQWIDRFSLELIKLVLKNRDNSLLLIGAYRDNEVGKGHILNTLNLEAKTIELKNISREDLKNLLGDTLKSDKIDELSSLIYNKTQGNPFYTKYLLNAIYSEGLIEFRDDKWIWDTSKIQNLQKSENVIDLLCSKLKELPSNSLDLLKFASTLGSSFSMETLSYIIESESSKTIKELLPSIEMELISRRDRENFKFTHDRIQQAVTTLITDSEKRNIHLKIIEKLISLDMDYYLFLISDLIIDIDAPKEKLKEYIELLIRAGERAKGATAYESARDYLLKARDMVTDECWTTSYPTCLKLYSELTHIHFLLRERDLMNDFSMEVINNSREYKDRVNIDLILIESLISRGEWLGSIDYAREVLLKLGIEVPGAEELSGELIGQIVQHTSKVIGEREPEDLLLIKESSDDETLSIMKILTLILPATYIALPGLFPVVVSKMVEISVTRGNSPMSVLAYANYGIVVCGMLSNTKLGYRYGQLSFKLLDLLNADVYRTRTLNNINVFLNHWQEPLKNSLFPLKECYYSGIESGDLVFAGYSINAYIYHYIFSGLNIKELEGELPNILEGLKDLKQEGTYTWASIHRQFILNLNDSSRKLETLSGECYREEAEFPKHLENSDYIALFYLNLYKGVLNYLFYNYDLANTFIGEARKYKQAASGMPLEPIFIFFETLISFSVSEEVTPLISENISLYKKWAEDAPHNYRHKYYLLKAEEARVESRDGETREYYDKALKIIDRDEFENDKAIINECAGRYYFNRELYSHARLYLNNSIYNYQLWGADEKVKGLKEKFYTLFQFRKGELPSIYRSTSSSETNSTLDLLAVLNASQTISQEIVLDKLIDKLMDIVITVSGAAKGYFISIKGERFIVKNSGNDTELPLKLLTFARRSRKKILVSDIKRVKSFYTDPYIEKFSPKSILIIPLIRHSQCSSILYLENRDVYDVFTEKRVNILDMLSTQIAISIENAYIHQNLERIVETRTNKINEKNFELERITAKLKTSNQKLELLASVDPLTGLYNRRHFFIKAESILKEAIREGALISLYMMDIDFFKKYNDTYGHLEGDKCLIRVANSIKTFFQRSRDIVARYGGEEFIGIVCPESQREATEVAEKISSRIRYEKINNRSSEINSYITLSTGLITLIPDDNTTIDELIKRADEALYIAKKEGRNMVISL